MTEATRPTQVRSQRGAAPAALDAPAAGPGARDRYRAAVTTLGPGVLLAALLYHPPLGDLRDKADVAAALEADTARWGASHLLAGLGAALVMLAFLAVIGFVGESGERARRTGALAVPFVVIGSVLFAFLPAMEIAMLGVERSGGDVEQVLIGMDAWFFPVLFSGSALFAAGAALVAAAVVRSRVLDRRTTWLVVAGLLVTALARFVPFGAALYVGGVALVVALSPLAHRMLRPPTRGAN